ncbi:tyrosine-protein phosphatase Lar-like isoform X3 [Tachypleus tridentatus]|uniref:tyrosine-protein phosphatase Lar-like isoform X3 n=1 Tax=Tachypleus tridentatus TaxID=6853 RepID=UPI003FD42DE7
MPGSNLNLTCVAEGSPVPYVKWRNGSFDLTPEHSIPVGKNVLQLENIQESTNYTCVAASKLGNIESVTTILVQEPPRIVTAPRNQTVISGGVASFVCTALGNPKPIIEWRKGNRRLAVPHYTIQETPNGSVLRIGPEHLKRDKSVYKCLAENGVGEPAYAAVELRVLPKDHIPLGFPQFTIHPRMKAVEKGRTVLLNCQAEGNPTPTITWLKNMIPLNLDDPRLSIIQGTYLQIIQAKKEDEGTYECLADNSIGSSFSEQALLYVRVRLVPPRFSTLPEPIYKVMPGSNLNLTCVAEGSPVPYVKWRNGSFDLTPEHSIPVGKNVLQLENIQESTNYTCVAASKLGNIESVTTILVQVPDEPMNVKVEPISSTSLQVQWKRPANKDKNGLIRGYQIHIQERDENNGSVGAAIRFDVTNEVEEAYNVTGLRPDTTYTVQVATVTWKGDGIHSHPRTSKTKRGEPPRIVTAPRNQTVISGGVASFVCTALGNPKPIIEWRKGNRRLAVPHYTIQETPNGSVLRIEPEHLKRDKSVYKCLAENGVGEPAYAAVELRVLPKDHIPLGFPLFTVHPRMKAVEKGRTVLLNCQAEGNPTPTITWLKNMIPLNLDDPRLSIIQGTYLQITQAKKEDEGTYECLAENSIGSSFSEQALLFVRVRLVPPRFSTLPEPIYKVMPGSNLNLTCVAEGSPVPYVKWRNGSFDLTPEHSIPVGKNVLQLENIQESTNYTCVAASKLGNIESVTTILVQVPDEPMNVKVEPISSTSLQVQWKRPANKDKNGLIRGYQIHIQEKR